MDTYLSADQATGMLGISKQTLYAYVSRGLVSVRRRHIGAASGYSQRDLERLLTRKSRGRKPSNLALAALEEGWPVLQTRLSHVRNGELFFRDVPALDLVDNATPESVARWLWQFDEDPFAHDAPCASALWLEVCQAMAHSPVAERSLALLALALTSAGQALPVDIASGAGPACAALLRLHTAGLLGQAPSALPLHQQFAQAWRLAPQSADLVRSILVLVADHDMNVLSFAGRCVASTGTTLGASLLAALSGMSGSFHGASFAPAEMLWDELEAAEDPVAVLRARLSNGESLPGFGHPCYPAGEPRAHWLLQRAAASDAGPKRIISALDAVAGQYPSLDFSIVALQRAMNWPTEAAFMLLYAGRTIGLIAQILEQQRDGFRIKPVARYVGGPASTLR